MGKIKVSIWQIVGLFLILCVMLSPTMSRAETPRYGGDLKILTVMMPKLGAPWEGSFLWGRTGRAVYETLVNSDEQEDIHPWLAESWDIADDGKSITFHLRKGIKFHDGTPFNAEAVKFNLDSWKPGSEGSMAMVHVKSVEVVDEYSVKLNLDQWDSLLLLHFAVGDVVMCSPTAANKPTTPENMAKDHMVGTGPFKIVDYKRDAFVKFVKNPDYWQKGRPYVDTVEFRAIRDVTVRIMAFESGDGQFVEPLQPIEAKTLEQQGYIIDEGTMGFLMLVIPDGANPDSPFAKKKVREAVEYAIDKEGLYTGLFQNRWPPAYQQALANDPYFSPDVKPRKYNPEKARALLAEAGYPNGFKTTLHGDTRGNRNLQTAIQTYLKEVGIDAELDIADPGRYTKMANTGWDGLLLPGFPNPSSSVYLINRFGNKPFWPSMYSPPGWWDKWPAVVAQRDNKKRIAQVRELIKTMTDEAMIITLYETHPASATPSGKGRVHDIDWCGKKSVNYWNPTGVWIEQ